MRVLWDHVTASDGISIWTYIDHSCMGKSSSSFLRWTRDYRVRDSCDAGLCMPIWKVAASRWLARGPSPEVWLLHTRLHLVAAITVIKQQLALHAG